MLRMVSAALATGFTLFVTGCGDDVKPPEAPPSQSPPSEKQVSISDQNPSSEENKDPEKTEAEPKVADKVSETPGEPEDTNKPESTEASNPSESEPPTQVGSPGEDNSEGGKPKLRARVKSPIKKLPPPEKEATAPPPKDRLTAASAAHEKSKEAAETFMAFFDAKDTDERLKWIQNSSTLRDKVELYHTTHEQADFRILDMNIIGSGRRLDEPSKYVFPYFMATTKNPLGFMVMIYEEDDGMKLSWEQFVLGQDYPLQEFLLRKDKEPYEFLVSLKRTHIFDPTISEEEKAALFAGVIDIPKVAQADKPVVYIKNDTEIGQRLLEALPWTKIQLCRLGLKHDENDRPVIVSYHKLAHPN